MVATPTNVSSKFVYIGDLWMESILFACLTVVIYIFYGVKKKTFKFPLIPSMILTSISSMGRHKLL